MNKKILTIVLVLIAAAGALWFYYQPEPAEVVNNNGDDIPCYLRETADLIKVDDIVSGQLVKSPLKITGEARGCWFFEASFPIRILDSAGRELGVIPAQAQDEWMTEKFVPFEANLVFIPSTTTEGTLVLEKDNPSGLPEHDRSVRISVRFK